MKEERAIFTVGGPEGSPLERRFMVASVSKEVVAMTGPGHFDDIASCAWSTAIIFLSGEGLAQPFCLPRHH